MIKRKNNTLSQNLSSFNTLPEMTTRNYGTRCIMACSTTC